MERDYRAQNGEFSSAEDSFETNGQIDEKEFETRTVFCLADLLGTLN